MNDQARNQALDVARSLEARGDIDASVRAFLRAGALDEATRVLIGADRYGEAGRLLLRELGVAPAKAGSLDGPGKKRAQKAAVCFSRAGEVDTAVELFLALGDTARAVQVLERAGQHMRAARLAPQPRQAQPVVLDPNRPAARAVGKAEVITKAAAQRLEAAGQLEAAMRAYVKLKLLADAGRMARALGNMMGAGKLFADGGQPHEAARCFHEAGDSGKAMQCLVRVPRDHPSYRAACVQAIKLAIGLQSLDFEFDQFLTRFIHDGPRDENEMEAFYLLGKLYQAHDFLENAREVYSKLAAVNPRYRNVSAKIASIDAETRGSAMVFGKIVREDAAFRGEQGPAQSGRTKAAYAPTEVRLPDLPELPPLPPLPSPAQRPGHAAPVARDEAAGPPPRRAPPARVEKSDATLTAVARASGRSPRAPARAEKSDAALTGVPASRDEIKPGNLVSRRYQIQEKLGEGGMAVVYKAIDLELNEVIAIKVFTAGAEDAQLLARFKRELTLSRQLVHSNIVRLYDIGTHHGHKFITMELLTGTDLHARMKERLEPVRAIHYLVEACAGLSAVHERGVVHRDIKPSNFFVTTEDVLKVMDFGIAKGQALAERLTISGYLAGTPLYMSPDQINHFGSVTHLSDLYSLGIVAYELFTGSVPFYHHEMGTLLMMHLNQLPEPPRAKNPQIPDELESIILQLLEKDPARRIQSCRELGRDLAEIGRGLAARRRR